MITLGLVGNPASGKSTVAKFLQSCGATWIDADAVAKEVLQSPALRPELVAAFGDDVVADGHIDRDRLAGIVFGDDPQSRAALQTLQSIVHPPTRDRITARLADLDDRRVVMTVLDVPLMFESGWDLACDSIWCVDAPRERREGWATQRGWAPDQLGRREANQLAVTEKARLSNWYLSNDDSLDRLHARICARLRHWAARSGQASTAVEAHSSPAAAVTPGASRQLDLTRLFDSTTE